MRPILLLLLLLLLATAVSADHVELVPDTLRIELSQSTNTDKIFQVTITNHNTEHFYLRDPTASLTNPKEDTYRFENEPTPGAARFHGVVRGSMHYATTTADDGGWHQLRLWKDVALVGTHVPAHGGVLAFNVTPSDHITFSAAGTYTMSVGFTLLALSSDKSELLKHHVSTNSINITMSAPNSAEHAGHLERRALVDSAGLSCTPRQEGLIGFWEQQAYFSVIDAKTEALGGKFHKLYPDDINFCFGKDLKAAQQTYIRDGLDKLQMLLDQKVRQFAVNCDTVSKSTGCQADESGEADSWFTGTATKTNISLCSSFFYSLSHCAYHYKSASNKLAGLLVRATGISKPLATERFEPLIPEVDTIYKPLNILSKLSADERVRFYPAWECFLSRRSKDPVISADACNNPQQDRASLRQAELITEELVADMDATKAFIARSSKSQTRRLLTETGSDSLVGRRGLLNVVGRPINEGDGMVAPVTSMAIEDINDESLSDSYASIAALTQEYTFLDLRSIRLKRQHDRSPCAYLLELVNDRLNPRNLDALVKPLTSILNEALGTGIYDLSSPRRQGGNLARFLSAMVQASNHLQYLQDAFAGASSVCNGALRVERDALKTVKAGAAMTAQNRDVTIGKAKAISVGHLWIRAEPRASVLARATVLVCLGAIFHDYEVDFDLSGDQLMNHVMHRLRVLKDDNVSLYRDILDLVVHLYITVYRMGRALTLGSKKFATPGQFESLGLHKHFSPAAQGRALFDQFIVQIHNNLDGTTPLNDFVVPAEIDTEFNLMTLVARTKRQEIRELPEQKWEEYVDGILALQTSGKYADLIFTHSKYFHGKRIHDNPRFLPWHRAFLITFDEEISKAMQKPIRAPYWDWRAEPKEGPISDSILFTELYFGGWGDGAPELPVKPPVGTAPGYPGTASGGAKCVTTGPFTLVKNYYNFVGYAGLTTAAQRAPHDRCLTRGNLYTRENKITQAKMLSTVMKKAPGGPVGNDFLQNAEQYLHNNVHTGMGGDMVIGGSPADPIFWSHHAMLDNMWANWQSRSSEHAKEYERKKWVYPAERPGSTSNIGQTDILNQGFVPPRAGSDSISLIDAATERNFLRSDRMLFLDPKFTYQPDPNVAGNPRVTRWTVQELLDDRYMYRTFQYRRSKYAEAMAPLTYGLDTEGNVPVNWT